MKEEVDSKMKEYKGIICHFWKVSKLNRSIIIAIICVCIATVLSVGYYYNLSTRQANNAIGSIYQLEDGRIYFETISYKNEDNDTKKIVYQLAVNVNEENKIANKIIFCNQVVWERGQDILPAPPEIEIISDRLGMKGIMHEEVC